jgi:cellulose synthase/poly-beta-1,6-N-acetylglucosamine synthase-like glycosyltransferase
LAFLTVFCLLISVWLSIYGFNAFVLIYLYLRYGRKRKPRPPLPEFPVVTVQLPMYNERYVVERVIGALARLDWPADRLQIQVLDDSTDQTTEIARRCVDEYRRRGLDVTLFHREQRTGFKAGALNEAMPNVRGAFVALFDADFLPPSDFLRRTIPYLVADSQLGFVQVRWGHLNDEFSALTLAQAIALDGHFAVEHTAREGAGLWTHFNGSGGIWRRECVEDCGGWGVDMLTEDLDLSYRAQLAGWRGLTLPDVVAPAEVPVQLAALKRQQYRWAKGHTQCLLRHGWTVARARLPLPVRLEALLHLATYWAHPLMLIVMLGALPLIAYRALSHWALALLSVATFGPPLLFALGQYALYRDWWRRLRALPIAVLLGTGLALNSTVAIIEALLGVQGTFQRTPKFNIEGRAHGGQGRWRSHAYALPADRLAWGEAALALYALLTVAVAIGRGEIQSIPFLVIYALGFGFVCVLGWIQAKGRRARAGTRLETEQGSAS